MAATWKTPFELEPNDGTTIWVVRIPYFDVPFQANYDQAGGQFIWLDSAANPHAIPIQEIFKWRDL